MAKKTQGTIDLEIGVNAELKTLKVKSDKFIKDINKLGEKVGPVEVDAPVKLSKRTMNRLDGLAADLRKGLQDSLKKSNEGSDLSIGIAKAIQTELKQSSKLLADGKLDKASVIKFLKESVKLSPTEAKKAIDAGGLLEPLIGKTKTQASAFLTEKLKTLKADRESLAVAYREIAKTIKVGESKLRNITSGMSSSTVETTAHIKALSEAMDLISNPRRSTLSKGIATDIDLVNQRVNTLKKGLTSVAALSAMAMKNPEVAYERGTNPEELVRKSDEISRALKQERAELKKLAKDQRDAEQSTIKLADARSRLTQANQARKSYKGDEEQTKLRLLKEQYAAAMALDKLQGNSVSRRTEALRKAIEAKTGDINNLSKEAAAIQKVLEGREKLSAASKLGIDKEIAAHNALVNTILSTRKILKGAYDDEASSLQRNIELLNARKKQSEESAKLEKALADARRDRQGYTGDDKELKLKLLKAEEAAALRLSKFRKDSNFVEAEAVGNLVKGQKAAIDNTRKLTVAEERQAKVLAELSSKAKSYQSAVTELKARGLDLTLDKWTALTRIVDDYGKSVKRASDLQSREGVLSGGLEKLISEYSKLSASVRDAAKWQAALNDASANYEAALNPKARLQAAQKMAEAVKGMAQVSYRAKGDAPFEMGGLRTRANEIEEMIRRQKELIIANNQTASSYNSLNGVMRSFFRYAVEFSALYKAQQAVIDMVTSVVQLEDALKATQAISRSTDAEMQKVSASVEQVAIDTEYSTNEIAAAAQTLAQAGVDIREVGDALEYVAMAASATNSSIATTTDIMTTMMNVFKDMSFQEIADQMTATINLSKLTGDELSTILSRAVEVSDTFNIVPEQMNAAFAVLRNSGIKASTISTGYRQALLEVFSPDEKTLRFLEKRYAELGQNLSQGTIAAMFQGFARSEDPIRAVTEELEKLGYSTSAAAEFARVFDVRATNVLDVLVKQRDEYIKLTTQIDNHGAALKGNQTQMESLSKSFENLGSIITVVANDAFGGMLGTLEKIVDNIGIIIQNGGKAMNILRENTGSSGVGAALGAGVFGGISRYMKTGSIGSALGRGTGIAAATEALQVGLGSAGNKITDTLSELMGAIGVAVTAASVIPKGIFKKKGAEDIVDQKPKSGKTGSKASLPGKRGVTSKVLDSVEEIATDPKTGVAATLASTVMDMVTSVIGWIKHIPKAFLAIGPLGWVATAGAALYTAVGLLDRDTAVQIDAIRSRVEESSKKIKKLQDEAEGNKKDTQQVEDLQDSVASAKSALGDFFRAGSGELDKTNEQIVDATDALDGVSFDLGSSGLAQGLRTLQERLGVLFSPTMDQRDIIDQINKTKAEVDKVEGNRAAWQQQLLEAYETDANDRTEQQKELLKAFESFSAADKASIGTRIRNLNQAEKYLTLAEGLSQAKDKGLQSSLAQEQGNEAKANKDIARLEVEKSLKQTGGYGGLQGLILQAGKDGNAQLISDLREEIVKSSESKSRQFQKVLPTSQRKFPIAGEADKASTLQFLDETQASTARDSAEKMAENLAELEKQTSAQVDAFRNALTPDQVKSLGLPQSAIKEAETATAKFLEGVPDEWKVAYHNAVGMNRTTAQSLEYLEESRKTLGGFPLAIENEYLTLKERAKVQKGLLEDANKARQELDSMKSVGASIVAEQKSTDELLSKVDPADVGQKDALAKRQVELAKQYEQFKKDYASKQEEFKNKSAAAGTPILSKEETQAGIEQTYKKLANLNQESAAKRQLLEEERNRLAELDNQDRIKNLDLNTKIYNLRVGESKRIENSAKQALLHSTELTKEMGRTAKSYQEIADWFNTPQGQDFLETHANEATHLAKLTEAVKDQELARRELTQRIIEEGQAVDKRLARGLQDVELGAQVKGRAIDQQAGKDPTKAAADETKVVLEGIKERQKLEQDASDEKLSLLEDQVKAGHVTQLELTKATEQELDKQLQSRKDYLSKALAEEKRHIDNIRNLKQNLKENAQSEAEFKTGFQKQALINQGLLDPAQQLQFDRNVAAGKYQTSVNELKSGDKVNGIKDMNDAIAEQQKVVTDLQKAEAEGIVGWQDTEAAYQDLLGMYAARKKATEEQLAQEEAAKKAATEAANAQLEAINALVEALNRLAERLATMPTLDLGVSAPAEGVPQDQAQPREKGVTGVNTYNDLKYETTVDENGNVTYSRAKKYSSGGLVVGPGSGTSDSIPAMLSNREYVLPADVVKKIGIENLEAIRKGKMDVNKPLGDLLPNKALANMMSPNAAQKQESMQPTIFQLGDASIQTKAAPSAVQEFQAALRVQSIKKGRRV